MIIQHHLSSTSFRLIINYNKIIYSGDLFVINPLFKFIYDNYLIFNNTLLTLQLLTFLTALINRTSYDTNDSTITESIAQQAAVSTDNV